MANREINDKNHDVETVFVARVHFYRALLSACVGICIGLLAPFGMNTIPMHLSMTYWVTTCLVGYVVYSPVITLLDTRLTPLLSKHWWRVAVATCLASALMSVIVPSLTWLFFQEPIRIVQQFQFIFPKCLLIGSIITVITLYREHVQEQKHKLIESESALEASLKQTQSSTDKIYHDFMKDIPIDKRGTLLCLEMADHYVKIHTDKGHHMVLMRFKDAVKRLEDYPGLQTHRSWWVAHDAISKVRKEQRKLQLELMNGMTIPVSRTYQANVVDAGFVV